MDIPSDRISFVGYQESTFDADAYRGALHSKNLKAEDLTTESVVDEIKKMSSEKEMNEFFEIMKNSPFVVTKKG